MRALDGAPTAGRERELANRSTGLRWHGAAWRVAMLSVARRKSGVGSEGVWGAAGHDSFPYLGCGVEWRVADNGISENKWSSMIGEGAEVEREQEQR